MEQKCIKVKATLGETTVVGHTRDIQDRVFDLRIEDTSDWVWIDKSKWNVEEIKPTNKEILAALPLGGVFKYAVNNVYIKVGVNAYIKKIDSGGFFGTVFVADDFITNEVGVVEHGLL